MADLVLESAGVDTAVGGSQLCRRRSLGAIENERAAHRENSVAVLRFFGDQLVSVAACRDDFDAVLQPRDGGFGLTLGAARYIQSGVTFSHLFGRCQLTDETRCLEHPQFDGAGAASAEDVGRLTVVSAFVVLTGHRDGEFGTDGQDGGFSSSAPPAVLRCRPTGRISSARQRDTGLIYSNRFFGSDVGRTRFVANHQLEGGVAGTFSTADGVDGAAGVASGIGSHDAVQSQNGPVDAELVIAIFEPFDNGR